MRKFYFAFGAITLLYLIAISYAFGQIGSPFGAHFVKQDQARVTKMRDISRKIENYYSLNQRLPQNTSDLYSDPATFKDPITNQMITYNRTDVHSYQLCATFDTVSKIDELTPSFAHPKGFYCFDLQIPANIKNAYTNTRPKIIPITLIPTPIVKVYFSPCGKYKTVQECNSASSFENVSCAWYTCKNVCLTTGTNVSEVCSSNVEVVYE